MDSTAATDSRLVSWCQIRRLVYVARSLHTTPYRSKDSTGPVFEVSHPRTFRRAFVIASLTPMAKVKGIPEGSSFMLGDEELVRFDASSRQFTRTSADRFDVQCPLMLSPRNVMHIARSASNARVLLIKELYKNLAVQEPGNPRKRRKIAIHWGRGGYTHSAQRLNRPEVIQAIKDFTARTCPEVIGRFRRAGMHSISTVYLNVFNLAAGASVGANWVLSAIDTFPVLMKMHNTIRLAEKIAAGQPPVEAAAAHFGIPKYVVRRFANVTFQRAGSIHMDQLQIMQHLPQHLLPKSRSDWKVVCKVIYPILEGIEDRMRVYNWSGEGSPVYSKDWEISVPHLLRGVKDLRELQKHRSLPGLLGDTLDSLNHYIEAVSKGVTKREKACWRKLAELYSMVTKMSIPQLARMVELQHQAHDRATKKANSQLLNVSELQAWLGLMPTASLPIPGTDLVAVELLSPDALLREGAVMSHCVAGYSDECFIGQSRIVSLRHGDQPISTIEFGQNIVDGRHELKMFQHMGVRNRQPDVKCRKAASWLLDRLKAIGRKRWPKLESNSSQSSLLIDEQMRKFWYQQAGVQ